MTDWENAACRKAVDPEWWWSTTPKEIGWAKQVCGGCPVRAACLEGAVERKEQAGVWGGVDFAERTSRRPERPILSCATCGREFTCASGMTDRCNPCVQGLVDAGPSRTHLQRLKRAIPGLTNNALGKMIGLAPSNISGILAKRQYVKRETAARILAIEVPDTGDDLVSAIGAQRRLRGLVAIGHSMKGLAADLRMPINYFNALIHSRDLITAAEHRAVVALYDRLRHEIGPSTRSETWARKNHWFEPDQWPEDAIDQPDARPRPRHIPRPPAEVA